jgi:uncharacterized protein
MPVQPTYPGVYVQEVPSGVRTIVGVSTSVTAFVGKAKRGPINKPVTIYNYSDYEKQFGGLSSDSEMSYAVRSFFLNGGSQAIIVRLAYLPLASTVLLRNSTGATVLTATALDAGFGGDDIDVKVDWTTVTPDSTFNLTVRQRSYNPPSTNKTTNYTIVQSESYANLSMNPSHPRYVINIVKDASQLISLVDAGVAIAGAGTATGAVITVANQPAYIAGIDATHNTFQIMINGGDLQTVSIPVAAYLNIGAVATAIHAITNPLGCACAAQLVGVDSRLLFTSNTVGANSRVEIFAGPSNDVAARLQLGPANGGTQVDAAATSRPAINPIGARLFGIAPVPALIVGPFTGSFSISLDGNTAQTVTLTAEPIVGGTAILRAGSLANAIQREVRLLRPGLAAYDGFTCTNLDSLGVASSALCLTSGTKGGGSTVSVSGGSLALFGLAGTTFASASDTFLTGGNESSFTDAQAYGVYIGSRALRQGIYALEAADIFNILCLPGIPNGSVERSGILMDADSYCKERRAFMIIDASKNDDLPAEIITTVNGSTLPKSNYAALYYPWIKIPDPLNGGLPRVSAPCGVMAGLYARTDASRGVWKAPAGTEATLSGVTALSYPLTDPENGSLNPLGINCLRTFPVYGNISWGARTLRGNDQMADEYKYVPIRRLALYIEESLYRGLKWAVFEPNDEPLWAQIRLNAGAFMQNLFRQGAFQGQKRDDAYFVKCDRETTTQNDINLGIVNIWIGFAPLKPAEFVILYIQQIAGNLQT